MKLSLIQNWRSAWRMYSVWVIILLSGIGSTTPLVSEIRDFFNLDLLQTILLGVVVTSAAVASRLLEQGKESSDDS